MQPGSADTGAVVQMPSMDEANWCLANLNGNIPQGLSTPVMVSLMSAATAISPVMPVPPVQTLLGMPPQAAGGFQVGMQMQGIVKRWDSQKGFGFIVPSCGGPDVFVHARELNDGEVLVNGSQVTFEAMLDPSKGPGRYRAKTCVGAVLKTIEVVEKEATDNLFVAGLPLGIEEEQIRQIFSQYGTVASVKKLPNNPGKTDCASLVRMSEVSEASWLVQNVNQNIPSGLTTPVSIRYAENKGRLANPGGPVVLLPPVMAIANGGYGQAAAPMLYGGGPYGGGASGSPW